MNERVTLPNLYLRLLSDDYNYYYGLLERSIRHIFNLYQNLIISTENKNKYLEAISEISNELSTEYTSDYNWIIKNINNKKFITNYETAIELYDNLKNSNLEYYGLKKINFLSKTISKIKEKIVNNSTLILPTVNDIFIIYSLDNYYNDEQKNKIDIINDNTVPLKILFVNQKKNYKRTHIELCNNENYESDYELFPRNIYQLNLKLKNYQIQIKLFFKIDYLNKKLNNLISNNKEISSKYNKIVKSVNELINEEYEIKKKYINTLRIEEIVVFTPTTIKHDFNDFKNLYTEIKDKPFNDILQIFKKNNNYGKLQIIKILLMIGNDKTNMAGLLFGLTKDRKESIDNNSVPTLLSEIIINNMEYKYQKPLRNSGLRINEEIERIEGMINEEMDMKTIIAASENIPDNIKQKLLNKLEELKNSTGGDHNRHMEYVKVLSKYPWNDGEDYLTNISKDINLCRKKLEDCKKTLEKNVYGHDECKKTIVEVLGKWFTNNKSKGLSIGLCGPPGVGKTLIAQNIGKALGIPIAQINLGGMNDGSILTGHSFTYTGAQPGLIVKKMVENGKKRSILFFDELDKIGKKNDINEIYNTLIHATDPNTNNNFTDQFFSDVSFPLNEVLFIFSYNDSSNIDKILMDRIRQINVGHYNTKEKINIVKDYIIYDLADDIGFEPKKLKITDNALILLASEYTLEAGVRDLKSKIEKILMKINIERIHGKNNYDKIKIDESVVKQYLGNPKLEIRYIHNTPKNGLVNGLYATNQGVGGIMPIIIHKSPLGDQFSLTLTGRQGDVMRESVSYAFSVACNVLTKPTIKKIQEQDYNFGYHIHTPDGTTDKDGPSAGLAFTIAFISRMLEIPIRNDIAMTGEIDLDGNVETIGGIETKLLGAKKAGCKLVFIPDGNREEFKKINEKLSLTKSNFEVRLVKNLKDEINSMFLEKDKKLLNESINLFCDS